MIKPWKPAPGDRGPHRDMTLKPFQIWLGVRIGGDVKIDARSVPFDEYEKLGQWIAERVVCRFGPPYTHTLTVLYH